MRKRFLLVVFATLVIVSVFAQSTDNASRLVGTWVLNNEGNARWVFNADGTLIRNNQTDRYGATETVIAIKSATGAPGTVAVYMYSISADGRTLILYTGYTGTGVWLTKQ